MCFEIEPPTLVIIKDMCLLRICMLYVCNVLN